MRVDNGGSIGFLVVLLFVFGSLADDLASLSEDLPVNNDEKQSTLAPNEVVEDRASAYAVSSAAGGGSASSYAVADDGGSASAQSIGDNPGPNLRDYPSPYGSVNLAGLSPAQADALASANAGYTGPSPYGLNQAQADAAAVAQSSRGYTSLSPFYPPTVANTAAQAEAQALSLGEAPSEFGSFNPQSGFGSASGNVYSGSTSQANAQASTVAKSPNSAAQSEAQALSGGGAPSGLVSYNPPSGFGPAPGSFYPGSSLSAHAEASAVAKSDVGSRLVPPTDFILPHLLPGYENVVTCTREGELYYFWSPSAECSVCACIRELGFLRPVCASCGGCFGPVPPPTPPPFPPYPTPPPKPFPKPTPPVPRNLVSCDPLPTNEPFQNPLNPCQICICQRSYTALGIPDIQIVCQENPQCVLPSDITTLPPLPPNPVPQPLCDRFPQNVWFPHPSDVCKICECTVEVNIYSGQPEPHITCLPNPECDPTPPPFPPTPPPFPPTPQPFPPNPPPVTCDPLPTNEPFQNPLNPCQICICQKSYTALGVPDVQIVCQENPQCVLPPDVTTLPPLPPKPVPLPLCGRFPQNVWFPHPSDVCKICECTVEVNVYSGQPEPHITCLPNPDCDPTPPPFPPTPPPFPPTPQPFPPNPPPVTCDPLPTNEPFENPLNPCQICICQKSYTALGVPDVQIVCQENPQCVLPPDVTTLPPLPPKPVPLPLCGRFPENVWFPHPSDVCKICECTVEINIYSGEPEPHITCLPNPECEPTPPPFPPTPPPFPPTPAPFPPTPPQVTCDPLPTNEAFQNPLNPCQICICQKSYTALGVPDVQIVCQENPQCVLPPYITPLPPLPPKPIPHPLCDRFPQNVWFPHPSDVCKICECTVEVNVYSGQPEPHITCLPNPECEPSPPPLPPTPAPFPPTPPSVTCDPLPTNEPFENPLNPCQICICQKSYTALGVPDVQIVCQENPQCVLPPDVTTLPPLPPIPVPLPLCDRFPQNVWFPHPSEVCKVCECTVEVNVYSGQPEPHIKCLLIPECEPTPPPFPPTPPPYSPTPPPFPPTPPPVTCNPLPTNEAFQNPLNPCQICICQNSYTALGVPDVQIVCQENPQCVLPPDVTTLPPLPPTPVPLPLCGRFPQNVWFPHPSDVCKICECTVEVNVYSGQSEPHITCLPNPECEPYPPPFPPTPAPIPWPPVTPGPLPPLPPGPLPGPSPHESCSPFPPNIPFDHPWDPCRQCICSEIYGSGLTNVEVSCYTKKECCNVDSVLPAPNPIPNPIAPIIALDPICELKSFGVEFQHPADSCRVCTCDLYGYHVAPSCKRINRPDCTPRPPVIPNGQVIYLEPSCRYRLPYQEFTTGCNLCYCTTVFNFVITKCNPLPNCIPGLPVLRESSVSQASANAESNVIQNSGISSIYGVPASRPQNSAEAAAETFSGYQSFKPLGTNIPYSTSYSVEAKAEAFSGSQSFKPLGTNIPYSTSNAASQSVSVAEANSNQYPLNSYPAGLQPNQYPLYQAPYNLEQSAASAVANAEAQSSGSQYQAELVTPTPTLSPGSNYVQPVQSSASAIADAEALSSGSQYKPGSSRRNTQRDFGPVIFQSQSDASANADAFVSTFQQNKPGYIDPSPSAALSGQYKESVPGYALNQLKSLNKYPALGNAAGNNFFPYPSNLGGSSALAAASANAQAGSVYPPGYNGPGQSTLLPSFFTKSTKKQIGASRIKSGASSRCQYDGDKYDEACTVCYCHTQSNGKLYAICRGTPCV